MTSLSTHTKRTLLITILFVTVGQLALTLYLPALPVIAKSLHVSSGAAQSSVTIFLLAFGVSQVFYGFLSDRFGRKPCLVVGFIILIAATILLLLFSHSFKMFFLARFLQGLGAGSVSVLARAIIRDCYPKEKLASAFSLIIMTVSLTPALAPFIGGWLEHIFNWQMIFMVLLAYMIIITVLIIFFLPETLDQSNNSAQEKISIGAAIKGLIRHEYYLHCVGMIILLYSCQILYLAISPFVFEGQLHIAAATYGTLIMIPAAGYIFGNFLSNRLNSRIKARYQVLAGLSCIFIASLGVMLLGLAKLNSIGLLLGLLFILTSGIGLAFSNVVALSLKPFASIAGAAAAVSGLLQMSGTSLINGIVNFLHIETIFGLGISLLACTIIMSLLIVGIIKNINK
jgi:DHA1 family 2-module integral membrane pump EmrD-like MFS transporter